MKALVLVSLLCFMFKNSIGHTINKTELRKEFVKACHDAKKNTELLEKLIRQPLQDPLISAYIGALTAVKAKFSYFPWQKYKYCKSGLRMISQSVLRSPDNLEIRYLRILIETKTPNLAGFQNDIPSDKERIFTLFHSEPDEHLKKTIASFMLENNLCNEHEKQILNIP